MATSPVDVSQLTSLGLKKNPRSAKCPVPEWVNGMSEEDFATVQKLLRTWRPITVVRKLRLLSYETPSQDALTAHVDGHCSCQNEK